jgi:hypothetical protein
LEVPHEFSGIDVDRDDRAREQIGAFAFGAVVHRMRIAGAPVDHVERGIVAALDPGGAAAVHHGFLVRPRLRFWRAPFRHALPRPQHFAGLRVHGFEKPDDVGGVAGDADDEPVFHDERRAAHVVAEGHIGHWHFPHFLAGLRLEADEKRVGCPEVDAITVERDAAIREVVAS